MLSKKEVLCVALGVLAFFLVYPVCIALMYRWVTFVNRTIGGW